MIEIMIIKLVF